MTEKPKHKELSFSKYIFLGLWTLIPFVVGIMTQLIWNILLNVLPMEFLQLPVSTVIMNVLMAFAIMAFAGITQQILIYHYWGYRIRQWWWVTALGHALGTFVSILLFNAMASEMPQDWMQSGSLWIPVFIAGVTSIISFGLQAILLSRYFVRVWWYVVAPFVFVMVTTMLIPPNPVVAPVILGLVSGATLLWLDHITYKGKNSEH